MDALKGKLEPGVSAKLLKIAEWELEKIPSWDRESLSSLFQKIAETEELKLKQILAPFFVAISGSTVSLPLFDSLNCWDPTWQELASGLPSKNYPLQGGWVKQKRT